MNVNCIKSIYSYVNQPIGVGKRGGVTGKMWWEMDSVGGIGFGGFGRGRGREEELEGDLVGGEMKGVRWGEGLSAGNFVF